MASSASPGTGPTSTTAGNLNGTRWPRPDGRRESYDSLQQFGPEEGSVNDEPWSSEPVLFKPTKPWRNAFSSWKWELIVAVVAVLIMLAMALTLNQFDGNAHPQWAYNLGLNTIVAIYTTTLRALLVFAIAQILGQQKWIWFAQPRPLQHLETFDWASRGAWGCARFLFVSFKSMIAFLAAITTIISIAIGPFAQQAVKTTLCEISSPDQEARIPIAHMLPQNETFPLIQVRQLNPFTKTAILGGLTLPGSTTSAATLNSQCDTGNCTFPSLNGVTYSSMALCSTCEDVSHLIRDITGSGQSAPPTFMVNLTVTRTPVFVSGIDASDKTNLTAKVVLRSRNAYYHMVTVGESPYVNNSKPFSYSLILTITHENCTANDTDWTCPGERQSLPNLPENWNLKAVRCDLYPCLKNYYGEIRRGILEEKVISTVRAGHDEVNVDWGSRDPAPNYTAVDASCMAGRQLSAPSEATELLTVGGATTNVPANCIYKVNNLWAFAVGDAMSNMFTGSCTHEIHMGAQINCGDVSGDQWYLGTFFEGMNATLGTISAHFDNIATSVTQRMRQVGLASNAQDRAFATGSAHQTLICTQIDWQWLLYPSAVVLITLGLLLATIVETGLRWPSQPVWKVSSLPLLFHGLLEETEDLRPDHALTAKEMEARADTTVASHRLAQDGRYGFVVGY